MSSIQSLLDFLFHFYLELFHFLFDIWKWNIGSRAHQNIIQFGKQTGHHRVHYTMGKCTNGGRPRSVMVWWQVVTDNECLMTTCTTQSSFWLPKNWRFNIWKVITFNNSLFVQQHHKLKLWRNVKWTNTVLLCGCPTPPNFPSVQWVSGPGKLLLFIITLDQQWLIVTQLPAGSRGENMNKLWWFIGKLLWVF